MQARSNVLRGGVLVAAAVLAVGCADRTNPVDPGEAARGGASPSQVRNPTIDERFAQMTREVPGFGGYYRDGEGNLVVVLTNPSAQAEAARTALAPALRGGWGRGMIVRQGRYDFAQLHAWHQQVDKAVPGIRGVAFTDVNEMTNRVEIGISDATAHDQVRRAVSGLSIPQAALALVDAEAVEQHQSIRDRVRPVTGGLQISRVTDSGTLSYCTLGFTVLMNGKYGYFTNSHCTRRGIGTLHRQDDGSRDRIGEEVQDPDSIGYGASESFNGVSYTCPDADGCRFSDAARGVFHDSVQAQVQHGYIARPMVRDLYQGGDPETYPTDMYTVDGNNPRFRIVGKAYDVLMGDTVHKVGWRTGWTSGDVDRTCVTSVSQGLFCQLGAGDIGEGGDSGSSVFRRVPGSDTDVELVGLYWGTYTSPIANIERDMGMTLDVVAAP